MKIKLVEKDMFDQLESLALDGPAGKGPDVMMAAYDRIGALGQQGHLAEVNWEMKQLTMKQTKPK